MIFVDTGAWFASFVPNDANHAAASRFLCGVRERLVTTDYVLDESLTLFRARGEEKRALALGANLLGEQAARLEWVLGEDVSQAWEVFRNFQDKAWSFTDCTSFVVMRRLGIRTAFAFDAHFRQFGTVQVVP